jgi:hypothetical protein
VAAAGEVAWARLRVAAVAVVVVEEVVVVRPYHQLPHYLDERSLLKDSCRPCHRYIVDCGSKRRSWQRKKGQSNQEANPWNRAKTSSWLLCVLLYKGEKREVKEVKEEKKKEKVRRRVQVKLRGARGRRYGAAGLALSSP